MKDYEIMQPCPDCNSLSQVVDRLTYSTRRAERDKPAKMCPDCGLPRCPVCGTDVFHNRIYCSPSCKQKVYSSGSMNNFYGKKLIGQANGFFGKKHSDKTRDKMRKAHTVERRTEASERARKQWDDPKFRESQGKTSFGIFGWYNSSKVGMIYHRSSWERDYYMKLDQDPEVSYYETETINISYVFEGKERKYYPDVIVYFMDSSQKIVEIKPSYKLVEPKTQAKLEAARNWSKETGIEFELISLSRENYTAFDTGIDKVIP
jgi:hypothetical protein